VINGVLVKCCFKKFIYLGLLLFCAINLISAQENSFFKPSDTLNTKRTSSIYIGETIVLGTTLIGLNQLWYSDYPKTSFHFINDNSEWLQMDKLGHFYSTYHLGRFGAEMLKWGGAPKKEQLLYGATLGLVFLTIVEVFDGFSHEWGASTGDMIANASGAGLYVVQEFLWEEQRIIPKFSYHKTHYANLRPNTLGEGFSEEILKDYNGQTYWLSFNLHSFGLKKVVPKWLNLALGYSGKDMIYGNKQDAFSNGFYQSPSRQFFFSLDVDLTKIDTNSHFLKTIFSVFNTLKVPAPTLQVGDFNGVKGHFIYF
jgi:hypothetical protein